MGESRTELIQWLNDLLGLSYTKIEQCGTGAAYAQIIDSIYCNVPMAKLNWTAKQEYEYLNNYKVLQEAFKRNKINKPIPVDRLVKCKMQDNLEWLQWSKKFWDTNFPGHEYDAEGRRGGAAAVPPPLHGSVTVGAARMGGASAAPRAAAGSARASTTSSSSGGAAARRPLGGAAVGGARVARAGASGGSGVSNEALNALTAQMDELKVSVDSLEKERDFYFGKLREIELLVQERLGGEEGAEPLATGEEAETLKAIQQVLYSTEEGFEVPEGADVPAVLDEAETF